MRKAGVTDYRRFAREVLAADSGSGPFRSKWSPTSSTSRSGRQSEIAGWGGNVYVKIPVTNTRGESKLGARCAPPRRALASRSTSPRSSRWIRVRRSRGCSGRRRALVRLGVCRTNRRHRDRAGRRSCPRRWTSSVSRPERELIWASPREPLKIFQADDIGCHIITVTQDILRKLPAGSGGICSDYSLDTVRMSHDDASQAGLSL